MRNFATNKMLWCATTLLTLAAAVWGVLDPTIYSGLMPVNLIPGTYAQDILTIVVCISTLALISLTRDKDIKKQAIILGILGSFWYLYGIFSIERIYNLAYYLYLVIFASSFWGIVYSISCFEGPALNITQENRIVRFSTVGFSLIIAVLFIVLWSAQLQPLIAARNRIEYLYSIYVLDICFVMPAFLITAFLTLKKRGLGILLTPAMYILGVFVIFPLGLGEVAKPYYGMSSDVTSMLLSFVFTALFIIFAVASLKTQNSKII